MTHSVLAMTNTVTTRVLRHNRAAVPQYHCYVTFWNNNIREHLFLFCVELLLRSSYAGEYKYIRREALFNTIVQQHTVHTNLIE